MSDLLEKAVESVRRLSPDDQDEIARVMLHLARQDMSEEIDSAHLPDIMEGLGQARRGEFATDTEIEAVFRRFGR